MVDMPTMHNGAVKIRRGRRTDLSALPALLLPESAVAADKARARHWRRLAGDPGLDFYVAEQNGAILGALLICYVRALREPGWQGILDVAFSSPSFCSLTQELVDFAKARAHQRGCQRLVVLRGETMDNGRLTALTRGGFRSVGEVLSCDLENM